MNWLIYLGGYWIGICLFGKVIGKTPYFRYGKKDYTNWVHFIAFTMTWVWICWKFISGGC